MDLLKRNVEAEDLFFSENLHERIADTHNELVMSLNVVVRIAL